MAGPASHRNRLRDKRVVIIKRGGSSNIDASDIEVALGYVPEDAAATKVETFNTRSGAVVLNYDDVVNALGYTPGGASAILEIDGGDANASGTAYIEIEGGSA